MLYQSQGAVVLVFGPNVLAQLPFRYLVERYEIELGHKVALTKRINGCDVERTDETEA